MRRYTAALTAALMLVPGAVAAKDPPPAQPATEPDWSAVRHASEAALRAHLIDPVSAQIAWPTGFRWASFKPFLGKRVYGWTGCGTVNARNRMGGYDGTAAFAIVYSGSAITLFDIDNDGSLGIVGGQCAQLSLPPPQPAFVDAAPAPMGATASIADELAKLAKLRDSGVLTAAEFDAQKAKLLAK